MIASKSSNLLQNSKVSCIVGHRIIFFVKRLNFIKNKNMHLVPSQMMGERNEQPKIHLFKTLISSDFLSQILHLKISLSFNLIYLHLQQ